MLTRFLGNERGYSMVEVLVAILILTIAILPMFKMFDVALGTTTKTRSYDLAQSLAEKQAELVQANTYANVRDNFPESFAGFSGCGSPTGAMNTPSGRTVSSCRDSDSVYGNFTFSVNKKYVALPAAGGTLTSSTTDQRLLQVTIAVTRNGDGSPLFTTSGVIAE